MCISVIQFLETVKLLAEMCPNTFMGQVYNAYLKNKKSIKLFMAHLVIH